jgi:uncharacterized RDD family membrane protein YckC
MTDQPPGPPPGNFPPPQGGGFPSPYGDGFPPNYGYPPPGYPHPGYGMPFGAPVNALPTQAYTPWITRVLAFLIDYVPYLIIIGVGLGIFIGTQECVDFSDGQLGELLGESYNAQVCTDSTAGRSALYLSVMVGLAFVLWNYGYRQGTTGSSIGKSVMKFTVVSEKTGQPLGFGLSIVRQLTHLVIDGLLCGIGFLFPLWDNKRQTLADKIVGTVCLPR